MGDGGVACVPTQHVIERFSVSDTFYGNANNKVKSKSIKFRGGKIKTMKFAKKDEFCKAGRGGKVVKEVENGYGSGNEEVEEGELGSLKWPGEVGGDVENGEFVSEKPRRFEIKSEIEKGEYSVDRWRKGGDVEKWRKGDVHKLEFSSGRLEKTSRRGDFEKAESASWRGPKEEAEKGEFIPDRWRGRSEVVRDDNSYSKMRRHDNFKDKGWKSELRRTPPSGKYSGEKDFSRNGGQFSKRFSRWEGNNQERTGRISSKIVDEEGSLKNEFSNGKSHGRDYPLGNRLKRHAADPDILDRKYHGDSSDYTPFKSRRLSDDGSRTTYPDQSYRNSFNTRNTADRYPSRNCESPLPSRGVYDRHNSSPRHSERSPLDRAHYHDHRDRSPSRRDRSPYARSRHYEHRNRSPSYSEWSPQDQGRYHDRRERTPSFPESPPSNRVKSSNYRETNRKGALNEKRQIPSVNKGQEEKLSQGDSRDSSGIEIDLSAKDSEDRSNLDNRSGSLEKSTSQHSLKDEESYSPNVNCESTQVNGTTEELASMEEDMDICDTPPHATVVADSITGKWFYLDHFGVEQGPSKLCDLKMLVEEGFLVSDHLIKHLDSDRWVTVENAVSPLVTANFQSIFSDAVTQLVSPPEAPGNVLADVGDVVLSGNRIEDKALTSLSDPTNESTNVAVSPEDLRIDERIGALFDGFPTVPGRELETIEEVLQIKFEHGEWERWGNFEGFTSHQMMDRKDKIEGFTSHQMMDRKDKIEGDSISSYIEIPSKETVGSCSSGPLSSDKDSSFRWDEISDWFSGRWSCKGGDWKRIDETTQDRGLKKKFVLNDGYALCQMPISGQEDPRWQCKDELYYPSQSRSLDLPSWAFSSSDESSEYNSGSKLSQIKYFGTKGVKGTMLPVIRINTCVVKDHGSFVSEPQVKVRGKERYSSRSSRHYSSTSDSKRSSEEGASRSKHFHEQDYQTTCKSIMLPSIPKDRLSTAEDLQLHVGDWYYLDGAGHEQGPLSFPELQVLADQGIIQKHTSVFRKLDKVWVPVTSASENVRKSRGNHSVVSTNNSTASNLDMGDASLSSFHCLHPQYIGYTRGKLHELIMKSYKSRELAAAINEVLEPWINERQPKKEIEKQAYSSASSNQYLPSDQARGNKRARMAIDGIEEDGEMEDDISTAQNDENSFDNLYRDATFTKEDTTSSQIEAGSWGLLDGFVLARVFHFLRADIKSLVYATSTCKHWRSVTKFYKDISRQADLSAVAPNCTDLMMLNIMNGYNKERITSLVLRGCRNITSTMLEEIIKLFPCISSVDIRGCSQFEDLTNRFPNIGWFKNRGLNSNLRNAKHTAEANYDGRDSQLDDSSGLRDYFESQAKRDSANQLFRQSLYKRSKVFDARKSSSLLSRGAQLRRLAIKKSENGYKRMKEFLALGLKDIMKENTFEFFVPKVAEIEDRMKNGYYAGRGLSSVKDDISRMCRDAIKSKNRGDTRDMNRIVTLFIRLATSLEASYKSSYERDKIMRTWKEDFPPGFTSGSSKYKKQAKVAEKKYMSRSNGSFVNGGNDYGEYVSDCEIKRRLSKLNKKSFGSGSETSDDHGRSSEETETDSDSTASDTDSDGDRQSEAGAGESRGDSNSTVDDGFESTADDREWGARMTKASLVPPVTRKYEVIERYVVVADEEEVQRKMRVTLPADYAEKLIAQKNGTEESDMDFPEVKDYKPRKQLGDEVIEQEVYGIDPYTHNLLLDSMPNESDWTLLDKHFFIEEVLLRALNKKVRNFTGTGNTPMVYALQPVIRDILKTAEEEHDTRTAGLCQFMLNAIGNRVEDSYVAYRKGLGVVCNKEGGFGEDDFVVEFLGEVYPAWKWFEKQDGIRALQKDSKEPAPEFYNIYLERPKGDADGYDLVVVDAMHKANYASRICHSCKPNCEAKVTAVDGQYQIGIYSVRPIGYGEEVTFDYNSVTESKEEYEASVCLCGSQICRGSYLNLTGEGAFQKVLKDCHGLLNRHQLMLEACELNSVSDEDYIELGKAGLGSCLLGGLPDWLIAYAARLVRFINFERTKLPEEILRHNLEEKRKYFTDVCLDVEKSDAEVQAEGVYNQRLQNLALTLDKVRYVMRCVFSDPKKAPPLLERLSPEEAVSFVWKGEGSFVEELIECISPYMEDRMLKDLRSNIRAHDPSGSDDLQRELRKSLLWLRDEVRNLPCTYKCRHDAAADLIHIYAFTKSFFRIREYKAVTSPPVYISPLDLGPKSAEKLGQGFHEYRKSYGENYCLGQLIFWHNQANAEPDVNLARSSRGCLALPDIGSFYAKVQKPSRQRVYGPRTVKSMLTRMEKQPQRPWPKDKIWSYKSAPKVLGSPMLDAVLRDAPLEKELVHWLKHRPPIFQAMWDR